MDRRAYNPGQPQFRVATPAKLKNNKVKDTLEIKIGREGKIGSIDMHHNEKMNFTSKQNQEMVQNYYRNHRNLNSNNQQYEYVMNPGGHIQRVIDKKHKKQSMWAKKSESVSGPPINRKTMVNFTTVDLMKQDNRPSMFNIAARRPSNIWQGSTVSRDYLPPHDGLFHQQEHFDRLADMRYRGEIKPQEPRFKPMVNTQANLNSLDGASHYLKKYEQVPWEDPQNSLHQTMSPKTKSDWILEKYDNPLPNQLYVRVNGKVMKPNSTINAALIEQIMALEKRTRSYAR